MEYDHNWPRSFRAKVVKNANPCNLEIKVRGCPLNMTLIYIFMFLVIKVSVPYVIHKLSVALENLTFRYSSNRNAEESQNVLFVRRTKVILGS